MQSKSQSKYNRFSQGVMFKAMKIAMSSAQGEEWLYTFYLLQNWPCGWISRATWWTKSGCNLDKPIVHQIQAFRKLPRNKEGFDSRALLFVVQSFSQRDSHFITWSQFYWAVYFWPNQLPFISVYAKIYIRQQGNYYWHDCFC